MVTQGPTKASCLATGGRGRLARIAAGLLAAALLGGSAWAQDSAGPAGGDYTIGPGDELNIVVWRNEELTMTVPVRPDGWISLPLVDDVEVAGLTPVEVRDLLIVELEEYIASPLVSVIVTRVGSFKVSILGNVRTPGRFDLEGRPTVLDVLALAGGPDEFANESAIYLLRHTDQGFEKLEFRYSAALEAEEEGANLFVKPGDIVIVP